MAANPFEFVNAINKTKENLFETQGYRNSDYISFIINRAFSNFADTIFIANECNYRLKDTPAKSQFEFYLNIVTPRSRYKKFYKNPKDDRIEIIMSTYNISREKAGQVADLFSDEDIAEMIKVSESIGGKSRPK